MSKAIEAFVFDAYGTLFDVNSVVRKAEALFEGKGPALSETWRLKQLEYSWLRTLMGRYEDFASVTSDALDWSLESLGLQADAHTLRSLLDEYRRLAPFPEVPPSLAELSGSLEL